jgi:hypothetical protein
MQRVILATLVKDFPSISGTFQVPSQQTISRLGGCSRGAVEADDPSGGGEAAVVPFVVAILNEAES